jgi:hypothetical protein
MVRQGFWQTCLTFAVPFFVVAKLIVSRAEADKKSFLNIKYKEGPLFTYLIPWIWQVILCPIFFHQAVSGVDMFAEDKSWWFGDSPAQTTFFAVQVSHSLPARLLPARDLTDTTARFQCAYFLAETASSGKYHTTMIRAHHVAGFISCVLADTSSKWHGINISLTVVMEIGSALRSGWEANFLPLLVAQAGMVLSSAIPMVWIMYACFTAGHGPDIYTWPTALVSDTWCDAE